MWIVEGEPPGGSMPDADERDEREAGPGGIHLHAHVTAGQEELEGEGGLSGQQGALLPGLGGETEELAQQGVPDIDGQQVHPRLQRLWNEDGEGLSRLLGNDGFNGSHAPTSCQNHTLGEPRDSGGLRGRAPGGGRRNASAPEGEAVNGTAV